MNAISVVIITRNEAANITDCIRSARLVSDDIVVVDAHSTDGTLALAEAAGAHGFICDWQGYGHARNYGAARTQHDWILALDADEHISADVAAAIRQLSLPPGHFQFRFRRRNFIGAQRIRFGTAGSEKVTRIYNRKYAAWDLSLVHERLVSDHAIRQRIGGYIDHFSAQSLDDHRIKCLHYAQMSAEKYLAEGRRPGWLKRFASPAFNAIKSYVFLLGFLDGRMGWELARIIAYYSWLKYDHLFQLRNKRLVIG